MFCAGRHFSSSRSDLLAQGTVGTRLASRHSLITSYFPVYFCITLFSSSSCIHSLFESSRCNLVLATVGPTREPPQTHTLSSHPSSLSSYSTHALRTPFSPIAIGVFPSFSFSTPCYFTNFPPLTLASSPQQQIASHCIALHLGQTTRAFSAQAELQHTLSTLYWNIHSLESRPSRVNTDFLPIYPRFPSIQVCEWTSWLSYTDMSLTIFRR